MPEDGNRTSFSRAEQSLTSLEQSIPFCIRIKFFFLPYATVLGEKLSFSWIPVLHFWHPGLPVAHQEITCRTILFALLCETMPNGDAEDSENVLIWVYFSELLTYNAKGSICQSLSWCIQTKISLSKKKKKFTVCISFVMQAKLFS